MISVNMNFCNRMFYFKYCKENPYPIEVIFQKDFLYIDPVAPDHSIFLIPSKKELIPEKYFDYFSSICNLSVADKLLTSKPNNSIPTILF